MKKIFLIICIAFAVVSNAQTDLPKDTMPSFLANTKIPEFKLLKTDSKTYFSNTDLPTDKKIVVMYFSPDCGHCQIQVKQITDSMAFFKDVFFVFTTYKKMPELEKFVQEYKLNNYPNIVCARDEEYNLPRYYKVKFTPFIGIYNKQGVIEKIFTQGATIAWLKEWLL